MDNIVIWGCGKYGKCYYKHFIKYWRNTVNVIGFVDTNYEELNIKIEQGDKIFDDKEIEMQVKKIFSPNEILNLYHNKIISYVFIGVSSYYYDSIKKSLDRMKIPCWEFPMPRLFSISNNVNLHKTKYMINQEKSVYCGDLFMLCDCGIPNITSHNTFWVFNKEKNVFFESFNYIDIKQWKENFVMYYPLDTVESNVIEIEEKVCVLARTYTEASLAHFMYELLDKLIYMEKNNYDGKYIITYKSGYKQLYTDLLQLLDIDLGKIIMVDVDKYNGCIFHSKQMYIFPSINIHDKVLTDNMLWFYDKIEKKIKADDCGEKATYPSRIFVKRIGSRKMMAYENVIKQYGFVEIIPEKLSIYEQMKYFFYANIVINPHGANCSNILFMRERTCLIECFDSGYVSDYFWSIVRLKKIRYQMVVSPNQYENYIEQRSSNMDYMIPEDLLIGAIENAIELSENF